MIRKIWVVANLLGIAGYLWLASFDWRPEAARNLGPPGPLGCTSGAGILGALLLLLFFICNMIALFPAIRHIFRYKNKTALYIWFAFSILWSSAVLYDALHSSFCEDFPNEISSSSSKRHIIYMDNGFECIPPSKEFNDPWLELQKLSKSCRDKKCPK